MTDVGKRIIRESWGTDDRKLRDQARLEAAQYRSDRAELLRNIERLKQTFAAHTGLEKQIES